MVIYFNKIFQKQFLWLEVAFKIKKILILRMIYLLKKLRLDYKIND